MLLRKIPMPPKKISFALNAIHSDFQAKFNIGFCVISVQDGKDQTHGILYVSLGMEHWALSKGHSAF